ncbi:MAG: restriction endonuclease [Proteobacteria bacterium]|nr:MAG: restriction endonuclease [Pseudomonadota bacterium]
MTSVPADWVEYDFDDCLADHAPARLESVPQSSYAESGAYPVVDQGASFVAGYTDDERVVHRDDLPLIVFGDHTRCIKYVDFPFATGADGTKLIKPNESVFDPRFLYFALRNLDIPHRGYNRHYSKLRELSITAPRAREEQRCIAEALSRIERRGEIETARCAALRSLKAATMAKLFREGLRGEPLRDTRIGPLPQSWVVERLDGVARLFSGGTPPKQHSRFWAGPLPWLSPKDMKRSWIPDTEDHISAEAADAFSRRVPPQTTFVAVRGMALAKDIPVCASTIEMTFNQDVKAIVANESVDPVFLYYAISARRHALRSEVGTSAHGTRKLGSHSLEELAIPMPTDMSEAREIGETMLCMDDRIERCDSVASALRNLFGSALEKFVTGKERLPHSSDA